MPGIYIHIPFCRTKCDYCNFFSLATKRGKEEIAALICEEISLRRAYLDGDEISTIYFGGGTPTFLEIRDIESILSGVFKNFGVSNDAEITLEANPDDLNREKLKAYLGMGINRLSIGIQSFLPDDLKYLNRLHNPVQARKCIEDAQAIGFSNLSIDLIFGIPTQDISGLEKNLEIFREYNLPHLSAYALTVEPNTALHWKIRNKKVVPVQEEAQREQFLFLMQWMQEKGYEQYEISNYCIASFESKHNSAYWNGEKYLGLGSSAHSFNGSSRQWNVSGLQAYAQGIKSGKPVMESEVLDPIQLHNEFVMMAIRTNRGISFEEYEKLFGTERLKNLMNIGSKLRNYGWINESEKTLSLNFEGKLFADRAAVELFLPNE